MEMGMTSTITLNDGTLMPVFGLGVYKCEAGGETENAVVTAIKNGYRLIDTASFYKNEEDVGKGIKKSGIKREDIFIVTKLWTHQHGFEETKQALKESLTKLGTDYVDLYLIHSPIGDKIVETFKAMVELKKEGLTRSVGVSNFGVQHLEGLKNAGLPRPAVNQIELHPWLRQEHIVKYCRDAGIWVMAYSSMARGKWFDDPQILQLAKKHKRSAGQIMLRWGLQMGYSIIPKSVKEERMIENSHIFDFTLDDDDLKEVSSFEEKVSNPAWQPTVLPWTN